MTLSKFASVLTRGARIVRDVNAVRRGRIVQRAENRLIGRLFGRLTRKAWR